MAMVWLSLVLGCGVTAQGQARAAPTLVSTNAKADSIPTPPAPVSFQSDGARGSEEQRRLAPLRAGFILNFASFTTWPGGSFESDDAPLLLTVVNDPELARELATAVAEKQINGRPVRVYHMLTPQRRGGDEAERATQAAALTQQLQRSHVVYLSRTLEMETIHWALDQMDDRPVLTISSKPDFAAEGGMFGLVIRERRLTFDANVDAIREADLQVSSKVLRLARIVRSQRSRKEES